MSGPDGIAPAPDQPRDKSRPRVLIVTVWFPSVSEPTNQTFVRSHALAAARDHDVVVLHLVDDGSMGPSDAPERLVPEVAAGLVVWRVPVNRRRGEPGLSAKLRAARRAAKLIQDLREPDLVHAHMVESAAPGLMLAHADRCPLVVTEHFSGFALGHASWGQAQKLRHVVSRADLVLPVSRSLAETLTRSGMRAPTIVVPNAVDADVFVARPDHNHKDRRLHLELLSVGRLHPVKGFDVLIESLALLGPGPPVRLSIVGEGPERDRLASLADARGVSLRLLGRLLPTDVADHLQRVDAFIAPSRYETHGAAAVEAAMVGTPIIASRVGGLPEVIDVVGGRLVAAESPAELASAIEDLRGGRYPATDAAAARAAWSVDAIADRLAGAYRSVMAKSSLI